MKITSTSRASRPSASSKTCSNPDVVTRNDGQHPLDANGVVIRRTEYTAEPAGSARTYRRCRPAEERARGAPDSAGSRAVRNTARPSRSGHVRSLSGEYFVSTASCRTRPPTTPHRRVRKRPQPCPRDHLRQNRGVTANASAMPRAASHDSPISGHRIALFHSDNYRIAEVRLGRRQGRVARPSAQGILPTPPMPSTAAAAAMPSARSLDR
jgi:hypothetical protein